MPSIVKMLKGVADPNRLRILLLLKAEELSVAELQEILGMAQSRISSHLGCDDSRASDALEELMKIPAAFVVPRPSAFVATTPTPFAIP